MKIQLLFLIAPMSCDLVLHVSWLTELTNDPLTQLQLSIWPDLLWLFILSIAFSVLSWRLYCPKSKTICGLKARYQYNIDLLPFSTSLRGVYCKSSCSGMSQLGATKSGVHCNRMSCTFCDTGSPVAAWGSDEPIWFGQFCCFSWWVQPWQLCCPPPRTKEVMVSWECFAGPRHNRTIPHRAATATAQRRSRDLPSSSKLTIAQTFCSNSWTTTRQCLIFSGLSLSGTTWGSRHPWSYGTLWGLIPSLWSSRSRPLIECATDYNRSLRLILMVSLSTTFILYVSVSTLFSVFLLIFALILSCADAGWRHPRQRSWPQFCFLSLEGSTFNENTDESGNFNT